MKTYNLNILLAGICMAGLFGFSACSDEEGVVVSQICVQEVDDTETVLNKVRLGQRIRIEGSGFATTKAIYCNGAYVEGVNPTYITDNYIIFTIPRSVPTGSEVENQGDLNTIRIVTEYDNFVYPFTILAAAPSVTDVSHTMPRAGERIVIYGSDFKDVEEIIFPGEVSSTDFVVTDDRTQLTVTVPEGISGSGALTVLTANGGAYSYNNFNFTDGLFMQSLTSGDVYGGARGSGSITQPQSTVIPAGEEGVKSPDVYRSVPETPGDFTAGGEAEIGGFSFDVSKAIEQVTGKGNAEVALSTSCSDVAFQCDYYVNVPWTTGTFRLELDGNRVSPLPWLSGGEVVPVDCSVTGWRTLSWALKDISAYADMTLEQLKEVLDGKNSYFYFKCGSFQDASGNWFDGTDMNDAQMSFGNFRLVPYTKDSYNND